MAILEERMIERHAPVLKVTGEYFGSGRIMLLFDCPVCHATIACEQGMEHDSHNNPLLDHEDWHRQLADVSRDASHAVGSLVGAPATTPLPGTASPFDISLSSVPDHEKLTIELLRAAGVPIDENTMIQEVSYHQRSGELADITVTYMVPHIAVDEPFRKETKTYTLTPREEP